VEAGLPDGMVYTDDNVTQGEYNLFFEEWTVGTLAAGATAELELTLFTLVEGVDIVNFVQVIEATGDDLDSTPDNNNTDIPVEDDEAAVTISEFGGTGGEGIDLELTLTADANTYDIFENVTYTIQVSNQGVTTANDIVIDAGLPEGMVYTGHSTATGEYILFFEEWRIDYLEPGEVAELELVLFTLVENQSINQFVEVLSVNEGDVDSQPGNGNGFSAQEDDEAAFNISFAETSILAIVRSELGSSDAKQMLYPNPASEYVTLEFITETTGDISIQIFNVTGQLQMVHEMTSQKGLNQLEIDVDTLPEGTYFLRMFGSTIDLQPIQFVKLQ